MHTKEKIHLYKTDQNSEINLLDASLCIYIIHGLEWQSLNARHLQNSFVLANDIRGPAYISNCQNCTFIVFCHQFRMHDCKNVNVLIACKSKPIIENCMKIQFGPNPYKVRFNYNINYALNFERVVLTCGMKFKILDG